MRGTRLDIFTLDNAILAVADYLDAKVEDVAKAFFGSLAKFEKGRFVTESQAISVSYDLAKIRTMCTALLNTTNAVTLGIPFLALLKCERARVAFYFICPQTGGKAALLDTGSGAKYGVLIYPNTYVKDSDAKTSIFRIVARKEILIAKMEKIGIPRDYSFVPKGILPR
jgi:hypothetical protein